MMDINDKVVMNRQDRKDKISVVMCTYNGEKYIREQLNSILRQTYPIYEVIIQDDCSTDNTYEILCEYHKKYPFVKVFRNNINVGINTNFFSVLEKVTGDYIAISDQDDIWVENKLEIQYKSIGSKLLCSGISVPFTTTGVQIRVDDRTPNYNLLRQLFVGTMPGHVLFFSKKLLRLIPDVTEISKIRCYDSILIMVAGAYDSITYVKYPLVHFRRHIEAATYSVPQNNTKNLLNVLDFISRSWKYNKLLKPQIKERLNITLEFLNQIESQISIKQKAVKMIKLYNSKSFIDFFCLQFFCLKHYKYLFYTSDINGLLGRLRALYFPISLSEYYRGLLSVSNHS